MSAAPAYKVIASTAQMQRPDLDKKEYLLIELPNKLQALLVSDRETDKAAAALDVNVGNYQDPIELPGLAHFLEHLLFMGTEKYPKENDYNEYLAQHGGTSNAFTSHSHTNYYFEVQPAALHGALDRFAQFFICPLFSDSCTERELNAVDSEHKKNLQHDGWRMMQLRKSLTRKSETEMHPYGHFSTGSYQTLAVEPRSRGIDTRQQLIKFHEKHYSANLMRLVVVGNEPVETLAGWAAEMFATARNSSLPVPEESIDMHPWTDSRGASLSGKLIRAVTIKDIKQLEYRWAFPGTQKWWDSAPETYLSHLIGHEGKGSLLSALKKHNYVTELSAGSDRAGKHFDFFVISMHLTPKGLENIEHITEMVFAYLKMLKDQGPQGWIFDELKLMEDIKFRFKEILSVSDFASSQAGLLHRPYPPELVLKNVNSILHWKPELVNECLQALNHDVCITLTASQFDNMKIEKIEPIYGTSYALEDIPTSLRDKLRSPSVFNMLTLPPPNLFLPKNLDVVRHDQKQAVPNVIHASPIMRVWKNVDDQFWSPRATLLVRLKSPAINVSPRSSALTELAVKILQDMMVEDMYEASLAGLHSVVSNSPDAVQICIHGFYDGIQILFHKILETMLAMPNLEQVFPRRKQELQRQYRNWQMDAPYLHAIVDTRLALEEHAWRPDEKLAALESCTAEDVKYQIKYLREHMFIESLLFGNVDDAKYLEWMNKAEEMLSPQSSLVPTQRISRRSILLPQGNHVYERQVPDAGNVNSAIDMIIQTCPATDVRSRALLGLFVECAREPAFNDLRTRRQLGYLVFTELYRQVNQLALRVLIQSERHPDYLLACIECFLADMGLRLESMSDEAFAQLCEMYIRKVQESDKTLHDRANRLWLSISSELYDFENVQARVEIVKTLQRNDLMEFYKKHLASESRNRRLLASLLLSKHTKMGDDTPVPELAQPPKPAFAKTRIADVAEWKSQQSLLPTTIVKL